MGNRNSVISLSNLYFPNVAYSIGANRIVGPDGSSLGLAERPNCPSIRRQIEEVMNATDGTVRIVVDDTCSTAKRSCG